MNSRSLLARQLVAITPNDSTTFSPPFNGLHCNVGGDVYVDGEELGTNVKLVLVAGITYPIAVTRVYATGLGSGVELVGLR